MAGIVVKPRSRIFHGHDWVYASEIKKLFGNPAAGDVISLKDFKDRPLGSAIYNPQSQIVARRISRRSQNLDASFFARRIERAALSRQNDGFTEEVPHRVVWSEADGLPGVVVDRYGENAVLQTLTLAMDRRKNLVAKAVREVLAGVENVIERNDNPVRKAEGLAPACGVLAGADPGPIDVVTPAGIHLEVDLLKGQKTGLYLDQFASYGAVARHTTGKSVLDCFSNQGGFALHCAKAGAASVAAVDISSAATAAVTANAKRNRLDVGIDVVTANVFDFLKEQVSQGASYDVVILDPPSFTKSKKRLTDAMRGYKEIHLRAFQLLAPGGLLATFCCSHHVTETEFRDVACAASVDAKKSLRLRDVYRQRGDHPVVPTIPETEYLKGSLFEVVASF